MDSIQYSHLDDRFVSGSKDGTARIWRHMRNEWLNLVLNINPLNRYIIIATINSVGGR